MGHSRLSPRSLSILVRQLWHTDEYSPHETLREDPGKIPTVSQPKGNLREDDLLSSLLITLVLEDLLRNSRAIDNKKQIRSDPMNLPHWVWRSQCPSKRCYIPQAHPHSHDKSANFKLQNFVAVSSQRALKWVEKEPLSYQFFEKPSKSGRRRRTRFEWCDQQCRVACMLAVIHRNNTHPTTSQTHTNQP